MDSDFGFLLFLAGLITGVMLLLFFCIGSDLNEKRKLYANKEAMELQFKLDSIKRTIP